MSKRSSVLVVSLVLAGVAIGLLLGSVVFAGGGEPGSQTDPLVARSYVDEHMDSYVADLEKQVAQLSSRAQQLETALAQLQKQVGMTPIKPGETLPAPGTAGPGSKDQKLYIRPENNAVNLRQGPGTGYAKVGTAVRGSGCEPMAVLNQQGDWYQVKTADGRTGWVAGWLVKAA